MLLSPFLSAIKNISYVDDSQLLSFWPSETAEAVRQVNCDLESLKMWSDDNGLRLNSNKCSVLKVEGSLYDRSRNDCRPNFCQPKAFGFMQCLENSWRHLWFEAWFFLSRKIHMLKCRCQIKFLSRLSTVFPVSAKLEIISLTIFPIISYALPTFAFSLNQENSMVLTRLQNRALRFVYGLRKFDHISEYRLSAGVLSVSDCCNLQTIKLIQKFSRQENQSISERNFILGTRWKSKVQERMTSYTCQEQD